MNLIKILLIYISIITFLISCTEDLPKNNIEKSVKNEIIYAKGFSLKYFDGYKEAIVKNPWDSTKILAKYIFISKKSKIQKKFNDAIIIQTPCERIACLSSTEVGYISRINSEKTIVGISQKEYIKNKNVLQQIENGYTTDLGPFELYNIEKLISIKPQVLFVSPYNEQKYNKIEELGIPLAYISGYMEESPLGRAEWIKFISLFFEKEDIASKIFDSISIRYNTASKIANSIERKPTVFSSKLYQDIWYISGSKSYLAKLLEDAGAKYLWSDKKWSGSLPIDFEAVLERCYNSDFWVLLEYAKKQYSYKDIELENQKYTDFLAFKNKNIIWCNTNTTSYFEEGILEPDIILMDFISYFHPKLMLNYKPKYFKLME